MRGRFGLAATMIAVAAVLCAGCAPAGSAGAGHSPPSPAPYPADTGSAPSGGAGRLWAVGALGESDAWAVGTHTPLPRGTYPLTEHWDGQRWRAVPCPSPGGTAEPARSSLEAVAIDAPDDAWAVGKWSPIEHVPPSYGLIEHWNGAKWALVPVPSSGGHVTDLLAVAAISPTAAWAIGKGVAGGHFVTVFMGWNGTRWRYLPSPGTDVSGPAVISAHDIWVVGGSKRGTLAEQWDGSKGRIVPTPNAFKDRTRSSGLYAVSGTSSSNAWAIGERDQYTKHISFIEKWNGTSWQQLPNPNP